MKIAIIAAMKPEIDYYLTKITSLAHHRMANVDIWEGQFAGHQVIISQSGIGKVNAALATTLIAQNHPDMIINTGSAGAVNPELNIGDVVIASEVIHHDVDATSFGYELGQVPGMPLAYGSDPKYTPILAQQMTDLNGKIVKGLVLTGDSFISDAADVKRLRDLFPEAQCTEMEGAAIAQVCYQFAIPVLVVRAISDTASNDATILFEEFIEQAGRESAQVTLAFIEKME